MHTAQTAAPVRQSGDRGLHCVNHSNLWILTFETSRFNVLEMFVDLVRCLSLWVAAYRTSRCTTISALIGAFHQPPLWHCARLIERLNDERSSKRTFLCYLVIGEASGSDGQAIGRRQRHISSELSSLAFAVRWIIKHLYWMTFEWLEGSSLKSLH